MALQASELKGLKIGSVEWFSQQRALLKSKPLLKYCYDFWYQTQLQDEASVPKQSQGIVLELGSGASYLKEIRPDVITSDVTPGAAEMVIDARKLPFSDGSVRAILLTHVFHHIPDVELFLKEADRVLVPGGVISMIEVAHTPFARFFFSNFHHEPYDDRAKDWAFNQTHAMNDSNQALAWNVLFRDRARFEQFHPSLKLRGPSYLPWFTYLLSGGVTRKALIPMFATPLAIVIEKLVSPLSPLFSIHWHLCLEKSIPSPKT